VTTLRRNGWASYGVCEMRARELANETQRLMNPSEQRSPSTTMVRTRFGRWRAGQVSMKPWTPWSTGLVCAMLAAAMVQAQSSASRESVSGTRSSDAAQKQLVSLLREPLPSNFRAQAPPSFYSPESLYQYIDGGADIYLLYDFKTLLHQDFRSGAAELTADIYEMGQSEDAFGIYAAERSPGYKFASIGAEGYRDKGILNFLQDRYYVKLAGSGAGVDVLLDQFAHILSGRIGGVRTLPSLLERLPREHRVQHSEQYVRKDPLGHAFLAPAYVVAYAQGQQESTLVVSVANNAQGAKARVEQLAKHFKDSGESASAPELGEGGMRARNSFEGRMIARTHGRYLIVLFNPPENGAGILKTVAQSLP
jgi:hypothetical protein